MIISCSCRQYDQILNFLMMPYIPILNFTFFTLSNFPLDDVLNKYHTENCDAKEGVQAVYHKTAFHTIAPLLCFDIRCDSENPAEYHKGCIAINHYFRRRGLQRPIRHSKKQDSPRNKNHNCTDCSKNLVFHRNYLLSTFPKCKQEIIKQITVIPTATGSHGISSTSDTERFAANVPYSDVIT